MNEQFAINSYEEFKDIDPFPDIPGTLLNSADIHSYVKKVGLIYPFYEKDLKSASYAARIQGKCKYWDEEKKIFTEKVLKEEGDKFTLKPNSIAFVGIEPTFRLPDYIALRFNLKITHVYRGLLLGTGPLIDPGFVGKISIPLHNLTSNEYVFHYDEALIWIEFTKTSSRPDRPKLDKETAIEYEKERCREFKPFPNDKKDKDLEYYLRKALKGTKYDAVISSVPEAVGKAEKSATQAEQYLRKAKNWAIGGAIVGLIGIIAVIVAVLYGSWSIQKTYYTEAISQINLINSRLSEMEANNEEEIKLIQNKLKETEIQLIESTNKHTIKSSKKQGPKSTN